MNISRRPFHFLKGRSLYHQQTRFRRFNSSDKACVDTIDFSCEKQNREHRYAATMKWLHSIVIKQKLCPFAPPVSQPPKLRIKVSTAECHDTIIQDIENEAHFLMKKSHKPNPGHTEAHEFPETTLVVLDDEKCPSLKNFRDLVHLSWRIQDEAINSNDYTNHLQQVLFHPEATHETYSFQDVDDAADYTIRSPYPIIHLLREVDVMSAVTSGYKDLEGLPSRNKARMRRDGVDTCAARLEACRNTETWK